MNLKIQQDLSYDDIEIFVRYAEMNADVERILALLKSVDTHIKCNNENSERLVKASDILYIESVDKKTFVYLEKSVYRTEQRLYQLLEDLASSGFVQISKSCILNINAMEYITPLMNSRMEATLKNGEKVHITRKYLNGIKQALEQGGSV